MMPILKVWTSPTSKKSINPKVLKDKSPLSPLPKSTTTDKQKNGQLDWPLNPQSQFSESIKSSLPSQQVVLNPNKTKTGIRSDPCLLLAYLYNANSIISIDSAMPETLLKSLHKGLLGELVNIC